MSVTRANCVAPVCNPSRAAMFSGLRPGSTGSFGNSNDWRPVIAEEKTMITTLRKGGCEMLGGGKLYHMSFDRRSE